jgi:cytochrome P450
VTIAEIKVGGKVIPAGEALVLANNAADRDETMFPDAHRLDLRRSNARASLVFGEGIHQCLGQLLARREMMLYHRILWSRMPNLQLAVPFSQIKFNEANTVYAIETLPVTWSRGISQRLNPAQRHEN